MARCQPARTLAKSTPSMVTRPDDGSSSPSTTSMSVLLPAPVGPITPTEAPHGMASVTRSRTGRSAPS
jgi:hypothetical protein